MPPMGHFRDGTPTPLRESLQAAGRAVRALRALRERRVPGLSRPLARRPAPRGGARGRPYGLSYVEHVTDTALLCADKWYGVKMQNGHVVELDLNNNGLKGAVPDEFGQLTALVKLKLYGNSGITGELSSC